MAEASAHYGLPVRFLANFAKPKSNLGFKVKA